MTGVTSGQTSLPTATDSDDTENFLTVSLTAAMQALANLFDSAAGHNHAGTGQGAPLGAAGIGAGSVGTAQLAAAVGNFGAFTSWAPAITQGGNPTLTNQSSTYAQIGKLAVVTMNITATSGGASGNDIIISTLPIVPKFVGAYVTIGTFLYLRTGVAWYTGAVVATQTTNARMITNAATGVYLGNTNGPAFAVANADVISFALHYEAA